MSIWSQLCLVTIKVETESILHLLLEQNKGTSVIRCVWKLDTADFRQRLLCAGINITMTNFHSPPTADSIACHIKPNILHGTTYISAGKRSG